MIAPTTAILLPPLVLATLAIAAPVSGQCLRYSAQVFGIRCDPGYTQARNVNARGDVVGVVGCALSGIEYGGTWIDGVLDLMPTPPQYLSSEAVDISDGAATVGWSWQDPISNHPFIFQNGTYTELPLLPRHTKGQAFAISSGATQWIAGYSQSQGGSVLRAVLWKDGVVVELPTPPGLTAKAHDVNDFGHACGYVGAIASDSVAFVWDGNAVLTLPTPPGAVAVALNSINASDRACGTYRFPIPVGGGLQPRFPFFWNGRAIVELGLLPGWSRGYAYGINNADSVVGYCESPPLSAGFVWHDGVMSKLNDLLEPGANVDVRYAWAINDSGQIACDGRIPNGSSFISVAVLLTPVAPIPGDLTCDWIVGGDDLAILLGAWGACESCAADVDANGTVDAADLAVQLGNWGDWNG